MSCNPGGIETFMMNLFLKLEGHGFHFTFINTYFFKDIAYQNLIVKDGGNVIRVPLNLSLLGHLTWYKTALKFFKEHHDYDIVYLNTPTINYIFWLKAAKKYNMKLIIHSHNSGVVYNSKLKSLLSRLFTYKNILYLNKHSNICELAASDNAGIWMFKNKRFRVITNGINTKQFIYSKSKNHFLNKKLNLTNNKVIMTIASLTYLKNYPKIIKIFYNIYKKDHNVKLVIIGDGPQKEPIVTLINRLRLCNNVLLLGRRNDVSDLLNVADLMLMPSISEGFPFSPIESQASGVPVLASKAIPEDSNITGKVFYLSLKDSDKKWAKKSLFLLNKLPNYSEKILMNKQISNSICNISHTIKQIKNLYLK